MLSGGSSSGGGAYKKYTNDEIQKFYDKYVKSIAAPDLSNYFTKSETTGLVTATQNITTAALQTWVDDNYFTKAHILLDYYTGPETRTLIEAAAETLQTYTIDKINEALEQNASQYAVLTFDSDVNGIPTTQQLIQWTVKNQSANTPFTIDGVNITFTGSYNVKFILNVNFGEATNDSQQLVIRPSFAAQEDAFSWSNDNGAADIIASGSMSKFWMYEVAQGGGQVNFQVPFIEGITEHVKLELLVQTVTYNGVALSGATEEDDRIKSSDLMTVAKVQNEGAIAPLWSLTWSGLPMVEFGFNNSMFDCGQASISTRAGFWFYNSTTGFADNANGGALVPRNYVDSTFALQSDVQTQLLGKVDTLQFTLARATLEAADATTLQEAKLYADALVADMDPNAQVDLSNYYTKAETDQAVADSLAQANAYTDAAVSGIGGGGDITAAEVDAKDQQVLTDANAYTDAAVAGVGGGGGGDITAAEVDAKDGVVLTDSKAYTDQQIANIGASPSTEIVIELTGLSANTRFIVNHGLNGQLADLFVELTLVIVTQQANLPAEVGDQFKIQYYNYNGSNNFFQYGCSVYTNSQVANQLQSLIVKCNDRPFQDQDVVQGDSSWDELLWENCKLLVKVQKSNPNQVIQYDVSGFTQSALVFNPNNGIEYFVNSQGDVTQQINRTSGGLLSYRGIDQGITNDIEYNRCVALAIDNDNTRGVPALRPGRDIYTTTAEGLELKQYSCKYAQANQRGMLYNPGFAQHLFQNCSTFLVSSLEPQSVDITRQPGTDWLIEYRKDKGFSLSNSAPPWIEDYRAWIGTRPRIDESDITNGDNIEGWSLDRLAPRQETWLRGHDIRLIATGNIYIQRDGSSFYTNINSRLFCNMERAEFIDLYAEGDLYYQGNLVNGTPSRVAYKNVVQIADRFAKFPVMQAYIYKQDAKVNKVFKDGNIKLGWMLEDVQEFDADNSLCTQREDDQVDKVRMQELALFHLLQLTSQQAKKLEALEKRLDELMGAEKRQMT